MAPRSALFLCASLVAVARGASAEQTYYVGTAGSDTNPGTQAQPFATIQRGLNAAQPGDTVNLLAGVYRDQNPTFVRSGTAAAPITLQAAPGASVVIKGS